MNTNNKEILIQIKLHQPLEENEIREMFTGCGEIKSIKYINNEDEFDEKQKVLIHFSSTTAEAIEYVYSCYKQKEQDDTTTSEDDDISIGEKDAIGDQLYNIIESIGGYREEEISQIVNLLFQKNSFNELLDLINKDDDERMNYIQQIAREVLELSS